MKNQKKYERAKKRAKELGGFYRHLRIFLVINGFFYLAMEGFFDWTLPEDITIESYYFSWFPLNLLIWITILVVHAAIVFVWKPLFFDKWEERKIRELMEKEKEV